jgi:hypothetical protein
VQAIEQARANGALKSRFEVDALPQGGRSYDRNRKVAKADSSDAPKSNRVDQLPTLFGGASKGGTGGHGNASNSETESDEDEATAREALKNLEKSASHRL